MAFAHDSLTTLQQDKLDTLTEALASHIPKGFERSDKDNFIHFVVPLETYPDGYHTTPNTPLPFISIGAQKHFLALYHFGIYMDPLLLSWFTKEWSTRVPYKLDMGKSCIRFKYTKDIPYDLLIELFEKVDLETFVHLYERTKPAKK